MNKDNVDGREKILRSLDELKVALEVRLELPEVNLDSDLEEQATKLREGAAKVKEWTISALRTLHGVSLMSREARELSEQKVAQVRITMENYLRSETPAYRRAAWLGLFRHELSCELRTWQEVESFIARLVEEGRVLPCNGNIANLLLVRGATYTVSPDALFEEQEFREVRYCLTDLLQRVYHREGERRKDESSRLREKGQITLRDLGEGKAGLCAIEVPPEKTMVDGEERWRGGCTLLVDSNGHKIFPVSAVGIERAIQESKDLGVYLLVGSLNHNSPPFIKALSTEQGKKVQLLWFLIKRAMRKEAEDQGINAARNYLKGKKGVISLKEWFLEKRLGCCFADYEWGGWKIPTPDGRTATEIPHLFLLVERSEEGVRIVETPPHLKEMFVPCMDKTFPEGEKFEGCPQPLRAVLQAIYGQVSKSVHINGKK